MRIQDLGSNNSRALIGRIFADREYLRLTVTDSGAGMMHSVIDRAFEPFYTTKGKGKATGLGLSVVLGIVLSHNGAMVVDSVVGEGTRVSIYLPVHESPSPRSKERDSARKDLGDRELRILVVDDERDVTTMLQIGFERVGHRVTVCHDGAEALRVFAQGPDRFDILVTDQTMVEMNGLDLIEAVKKLRPEIPCILCTGFSNTLTETTALDRGAAAYFIKPVESQKLVRKISELIDEGAAERTRA